MGFDRYKWYDWLGIASLGPAYYAGKELADGAYDLSKHAQNRTLSTALSQWNDDAITRQENFNSAEAEKQRQWETEMSNTAVQRQVADIKAAGLNPWLALNGGSVSGASTPAGASASSNSAFASNYLTSSMWNGMIKAITSLANSAMSFMGSVAKAAATA